MAIKYISIFHSKARKFFPKIGIFGLKTNHLATLVAEEATFVDGAQSDMKIKSAFLLSPTNPKSGLPDG
jgi:hypothetical protein